MLNLRFDAENAVSGHVFVRIFNGDAPNICGSLFLSMQEWLILTKVLAGANSPDFEFSHLLQIHHCDKCAVELSRVTCGLCGAQMCEACAGDHPHLYGVHIEGSTK